MVRPRSPRFGLAITLTLVTTLVVTAYEPRPDGAPDPVPRAADRVIAGALHGRTGAFLILGDAASLVDVRLAPLPGLLYRISTPPGSGLAPEVYGGEGMVRVRLTPTGDPGPDAVTIVLNRSVRWDIRLPAGAGEQRVDLAGGSVARLDLGSAGLVDVALPQPAGTVPVTFHGGVGTVTLSTPPAAPMSVLLRGGAGSVRTPWAANNGSVAGAVLTDPAWPLVTDRYAVYARAGVGSLSVRLRPTRPAAG